MSSTATASRGGPGPAPSDSREVRVKRALANPAYFGDAYFSIYDPNWTDVTPGFGVDMLRFAVACRPWPNVGGVIMLPPEFMKTTLISQVYPLWLTVRARVFDQLLRGLLLSEEEAMASGNLAVIKWHIMNNERLRGDFSDGRGRPLLGPDPTMDIWREDSIIVHRPGIVSRDMTWQAKGLDSKGIHGRRLEVMLGDDVVTPANAGSPAKRKSALDKMDLEIETRVVEGGQILLAGNFNDEKDLISTIGRRPRYRVFRRPSLHRPDDPSKPPAESHLWNPEMSIETWPENWHRARLKIEYKDKPNRFRRIHLLDPRAEKGDRLKVDWMTLLAEERGAAILRFASFYIGVDPAPGGDDDDLDYFNITVGALTQNHFDICQSLSVRADTPRQVKILGIICDSYSRIGSGVKKIGVSKVTADRYFAGAVEIGRPDLKRKLERISIPQGEAAKEVRLEGLGPMAFAGWLRCWEDAWTLRTSDDVDQNQELTFEEEWREFPYGGHDDRLDGCDIAIRCAQEFGQAGPVDFTLQVAE